MQFPESEMLKVLKVAPTCLSHCMPSILPRSRYEHKVH